MTWDHVKIFAHQYTVASLVHSEFTGSSRSQFLPRCMECRRGLAMRILSVRLSNSSIVTKRKKDMYRFLYHMKDHLVQFFEKKNGWWGVTTSTWNFGSAGPRWSEFAGFEPIIARSASAVIPSEKSSTNTNRKSPMRFPISLRWSSYIAPKSPIGGWKAQNAHFPVKLHFAWRKSATKFIGVKTVNSKVVRHLLA